MEIMLNSFFIAILFAKALNYLLSFVYPNIQNAKFTH